ncbi:unnamed protein product [Lymnaea stagnalis]|uniref:Carboxylic ester hydrolase n=1 Tax=Lymnaea stagnalis TaxID=6523 RepID=A0AAV2HB32_LYMST
MAANTLGAQLLLAITLICCQRSATSDDVIAALDKGQQLLGVKTSWVTGESVYKFFGIPYALPPIGARRFEPPVAALEWTGVKDARVPGVICPQTSKEESQRLQSEDCLTLSVFTPDLNASLPVLVWIHGGGYHAGSQFNDGDASTLTRYGIVTVSINYRLSPFGFLSTEDDVMPGNYGMLDQVLALKWVQKNIRSFGGDPKQVTIGGESAGAFSVALQILSPLSKGLFHRAVMESGSALAPAAIERPGTQIRVKDFTAIVGASVGCTSANSSQLLQCLKGVDADRLKLAATAAEQKLGVSLIGLPRVETVYGFLPDYPKNLIANGNYSKVDTLRGFNAGEWSFAIQDNDNNGVTRLEFSLFFTALFHLSSFINNDVIVELVARAYLGNETDPFKIRDILVSALADLTFGASSLLELTKIVDQPGTQHYFYEFNYIPSGTARPAWMRVVHAEERQFVFFDPDWTSRSVSDKTVGQRVQTTWTNFIKYGDPTPASANSSAGSDAVRWGKFSKSNLETLQIGAQSATETFPRSFVIQLYEKILQILHMTTIVKFDDVIG